MADVRKRPVFVAITSDSCGACSVYKSQHQNDLISGLKELDIVDVVEINTKTMNPESMSQEYHPELSKLIKWYPVFMLFEGESWENHDGHLVGKIRGGRIVNGVSSVVQPHPPITSEGIIKWVAETSREPMFNRISGSKSRDSKMNPVPVPGRSTRDRSVDTKVKPKNPLSQGPLTRGNLLQSKLVRGSNTVPRVGQTTPKNSDIFAKVPSVKRFSRGPSSVMRFGPLNFDDPVRPKIPVHSTTRGRGPQNDRGSYLENKVPSVRRDKDAPIIHQKKSGKFIPSYIPEGPSDDPE